MAQIPPPENTTVNAIYAALQASADDGHRHHLGASLIGDPCERKLWYKFRWCDAETHDGRVLRLFRTGHLAENTFAADLRAAGVEIETIGHDGTQVRVFDLGGHFAGSLDGVARGFVEAPKTWHVVEFKTHSAKSFAALQKSGVKASKPLHWHQINTYMGYMKLTRAFYLAENKDTSELYGERVDFDEGVFEKTRAKALRIIKAQEPLPRISQDPSSLACKYCEFFDVCHGEKLPKVNCRTCAHATPVVDDSPDGKWRCEHHNDNVPSDFLRGGCDEHRYIPIFLERVATPVAFEDGAVVYETPDGNQFANGAPASGGLTSADLRALSLKGVGVAHMLAEIRKGFPHATVVEK